VQPEWAKRFRPSLEGFWDALNGGPGWPRECKLVFTGAAELETIDGGRFLAGLREIVQKSRNSLVPVQLIET
jgi:ribonuclease inhibitor